MLQVITDTDRRGAQVFATDLEDALHDRGFDTRTVALARGADGPLLDVPVLGSDRLTPSTLAGLRALMRAASVVVAHGSSTLPACAAAGVGLRTPLVYRNIGDPLYWAGEGVRRWWVRGLLARTRAVVTLWDGGADALTTRFGVPSDRVRVIANGVPASRCPPRDLASDHAQDPPGGTDADGTTVAYVGALSAEKNVAAAITAAAEVGTRLLVAGDGPLRSELERLAHERANGRVHFLGVVEEPARVYAASDLLVLPSHSEGMPGVLIEAGLCGLGAVATDVGAVREVIEPDVTGQLVPPGDEVALTRALSQAVDHAGRYGAAARQRCLERFEIGIVADRWAELLSGFSDHSEKGGGAGRARSSLSRR